MARRGKIARLPRHIRNTLNSCLDDGEQGRDLVEWLNGLQQVKKVLADEFGGRPVNEQNLTEWKQGGFREWQRQQETCERVRGLVELSDDLEDAADEQGIPDRLGSVLAAELAAETQKLLEETTDPRERWRYLCEALGQLNDLRQGDHTGLRATIERERWEVECERREQDEANAMLKEAKEIATAPIWNALKRPALVAGFGGGEAGEKVVDFLNEIDQKYRKAKCSWPFSDRPSHGSLFVDQPSGTTAKGSPKAEAGGPNQTKIKADQT